MKSFAFRCLLALGLTMVLVACGGSSESNGATGSEASGGAKKWTMMVYIAGDNSLSEFALADLRELKAATQNSNVNLVVQMEFDAFLTSSTDGLTSKDTYRGLVTGSSTVLSNIGRKNMGSPEELTGFIQWAKSTYPAEKYALVLWSHGSGWRQSNKGTRGALQDADASGWMTLAQMRTGISDAIGGNKLDVLAFDACLMGQYEVAYELRNTARYLVSSEELVPGTGMPYTKVANLLTANPALSALDFAKGMASEYRTSYASNSRTETTISVMDLSKIDALHASLLAFATKAEAAVSSTPAPFNNARQTALTYGGSGNEAESISLWQYADAVASELPGNTALVTAATNLKNSITSTVLYKNYTGSGMANAKGIAIYFPVSVAYLQGSYKTDTLSNTAVSGQKTWYEFLSRLYGGVGTNEKVPGNMAYYITWTAPEGVKVNVDLAVNEARGNWAAPFIGAISPNAFLSAESYYSAQNFESYTAQTSVEQGRYDVFASLYRCESTATGASVTGKDCYTEVTLWEKLDGASVFTSRAPQRLSLEAPLLGDFMTMELTTIKQNNTTDLYWFGSVTRPSGADLPDKSALAPKRQLRQSSVRKDAP